MYELGIRRLRLLTNNMGKYVALQGYGLELVDRVPLELPPLEDNREYLRTKKTKLGHLLDGVGASGAGRFTGRGAAWVGD